MNKILPIAVIAVIFFTAGLLITTRLTDSKKNESVAVNSSGWIAVQDSQEKWYAAVQDYVRKWVNEHKELKEDNWTPASRQSINKEGVWR